jgi:hypothetical protein
MVFMVSLLIARAWCGAFGFVIRLDVGERYISLTGPRDNSVSWHMICADIAEIMLEQSVGCYLDNAKSERPVNMRPLLMPPSFPG